MTRREVRRVKVNPPVRVVPIDGKPVNINEEKLKSLIEEIMQRYANKDRVIPMTKKIFKTLIYDLVIKELRTYRFFYRNLNLNIIWKQVNLLSSDFGFIDSTEKEKLSNEEEFDRLCWYKANKQEYDKKRFMELQRKLGVIEDG